MMPYQVSCSGDACGETLCSATAIPLSLTLATMVDAGRARAKLDAAGGIVKMPRKQCGLRGAAMRSAQAACDKAQARNGNERGANSWSGGGRLPPSQRRCWQAAALWRK